MRTHPKIDFAVPANHMLNLKESERRNKCVDLDRELKKIWKLKVTVKPIVISVLGTVNKWLARGEEQVEIRRRVETIQTTTSLRSARIPRRVLETFWDLL